MCYHWLVPPCVSHAILKQQQAHSLQQLFHLHIALPLVDSYAWCIFASMSCGSCVPSYHITALWQVSHTHHRRVLLLVISLFHCTLQSRPVLCFCHPSRSDLSLHFSLSCIWPCGRCCELALARPPVLHLFLHVTGLCQQIKWIKTAIAILLLVHYSIPPLLDAIASLISLEIDPVPS